MADQALIVTVWFKLSISCSDEAFSLNPVSWKMKQEIRGLVCIHVHDTHWGVAHWRPSLYLCVYRTSWLPLQPGAALYLGCWPAGLRHGPADELASSEVNSAGCLPG